MARGASEDGTRRQKKWRQIDPWVESIPKSGGRNFSIFCLHPSIYNMRDIIQTANVICLKFIKHTCVRVIAAACLFHKIFILDFLSFKAIASFQNCIAR